MGKLLRVCWRNAQARRRDHVKSEGHFVTFTQYMLIESGVSLGGRRTGIYYGSWAAVGWATLVYVTIYVFRMCHSKVMLAFG